jgi:hypothetical protein
MLATMLELESLGEVEELGRQLYLATAPAFSAWPDEVSSLAPPFIAVVVADASGASADDLGSFAAKLLAQGAGYVCAWGPDCERVHDVFDEVLVGDESAHPEHVMTTWHPDEPLDEALWFAVWAAFNEDFPTTTTVLFAVVAQRTSWASAVREWVAQGAGLDAE